MPIVSLVGKVHPFYYLHYGDENQIDRPDLVIAK